jgi:hypothetical protein
MKPPPDSYTWPPPRREIFAEHQFDWPEQPGSERAATKEMKLPWVWFLDKGEAQQYLTLWWIWQGMSFLFAVNLWIFKVELLKWVLLALLLASQAAFTAVWIPLCKRAEPPLGKWHWFAAGWWNPRSRHCLMVAWGLVSEK